MTGHAPTVSRRTILAGSAALGLGLALRSASSTGEEIATAEAAAIRSFRADIPQAALDDLKLRLGMTRWPDKETVEDQSQGIQLAKLQPLVEHWRARYDWRKAEARLNALPQFVTIIDGVAIHFIHVRSKHPGALPLILTHGWPGSVFEMMKTVTPLTDPTAHGGRAEDAFDVVIPSVPGFGFSGRPTETGWGTDRIARAWAELMKRLGYARYVAQGGDWGAPVSHAMARLAPAGLLGIHVNLPAVVPPEIASILATGGAAPADLTAPERAAFDALSAGVKMGSRSYAAMMGTKPQTIGYAVTDSPVGLAAWMLGHPGFSHWTFDQSDPERSPDEVLDDISLYWLTNTAASAGRIYWEYGGGKSVVFSAAEKTGEIALPVAVTVFPKEIYRAPETWARRAYPNLTYFNVVEKGGHFAAWEQPEIFTEELRAAFKPLRKPV